MQLIDTTNQKSTGGFLIAHFKRYVTRKQVQKVEYIDTVQALKAIIEQ